MQLISSSSQAIAPEHLTQRNQTSPPTSCLGRPPPSLPLCFPLHMDFIEHKFPKIDSGEKKVKKNTARGEEKTEGKSEKIMRHLPAGLTDWCRVPFVISMPMIFFYSSPMSCTMQGCRDRPCFDKGQWLSHISIFFGKVKFSNNEDKKTRIFAHYIVQSFETDVKGSSNFLIIAEYL